MNSISTIKGFALDFTPLQVTCNLYCDSSVTSSQVYNAWTKEFVPDYTLVPLVLVPKVSMVDKDGVLINGSINAALSNVTWTEVADDGTETVITTANTKYSMVTSGNDQGVLRLKQNLTAGTSITLRFSAQYTDTRTNQVYDIQRSYLVSCSASAKSQPELQLDLAEGHVYNPLRDTSKLTIHASAYVDGDVCPTKDRIFVWDISYDGKSYAEIGSDTMHYFITEAADHTYVTIDQSAMGDKLIVRCRGKFDSDGNPSSVTLDDSCPQKIVTLTRRIPDVWADIIGAPDSIPLGYTSFVVDLSVYDTISPLTTWKNWFSPLIYASQQNAAGTVEANILVSNEVPATISTSKYIHKTYGCMLKAVLNDLGPWKAAANNDGSIMTNSNGAIMLIH
jgi:hypothetical protein